jgi:hypothetical protein
MASAAHEGMAQALRPLMEHADRAARDWAARRAGAVEQAENALARAGLGMEHVAAHTLSARGWDFERIDRMISAAEARRSAALRELDLHRESFALRLRRALAEAEQDEPVGHPVSARLPEARA